MPAAVPSGVKSRRQRAGRDGDVGSVSGSGCTAEGDWEVEGAKAIVSWRVSTVALTASDSCS